MSKKILSFLLLAQFFCSNILNVYFFEQTYAAGIDLYQQKVSLDTSSAFSNPTDSLAVSPDQWFRFESNLRNNEAGTITNVSYYTSFPSDIVYSGTTTAATQVNGASTYIIPLSSFNPPTSLPNYINGLASLTTASIYAVRRILLKFPANHGVYQNTLSTYFTADGGLTSNTRPTTVYVNVKPHITDYTFSKSSVVGNGSDSVDLTVKVKDYNGCTNIDGWVVTANLSGLGLSSLEALTYNSCDVDGKTAIFKKMGITTLASTGDKIFSYTSFAAKDEDNNSTDPTDLNTTFDDEDKKTDITLTVATPVAPVVTISSLSPTTVSSVSGYDSSTLSFSADKAGTYKVVVNGNGACSAGTIMTDWTAYATGVTINTPISAGTLSDGTNTLYACVKNDVGDIGSANSAITKDTTAPSVYSMGLSPGAVVLNDSTGSVYCGEDGQYRFGANGNLTSYQASVKDTKNEAIIPNAWLSLWNNTVTAYCKDGVWNESSTALTLIKEALPPNMTSSGLILTDNDTGWDGVDWRDIKVTFDNTAGSGYAGFQSYRIYLLPDGTAFTGTSIGAVYDKTATFWTGSSSVVNDSLWNPLSGGNYRAYVAIMGLSLNIGTAASATGTLVADTVPHPSVLSASFTSTGNLSVKFNTTLKTDTGSHSATGFVYQVGATTYTGTSVSSIATDTINLSIPNLSGTSATGTLTIATGSVWGASAEGSYNYGTGGITIADAVNPGITSFATGTTAYYTNFYSGSLVFNYTVSENLVWAGNTKIVFTRVGGNADTSKTYNITNPANLTAGAHSETVNLSSLGLVSGAYYDVTLVAKDLAGNTATSSPVSIKFDNSGPSVVSINSFGPNKVFGILMPTFTWIGATDDGGNGSGVKGYKIRVYAGTNTYADWKTCTGSFTEYTHTDLVSLTKDITLANLSNYAWGVYAYDNMENVGTISSCDNFYINTDIPNFSSASITDTVLNNTSYTKGGNSLVIQSTITNSDSSHIWLNASTIKDSSYANISCASPGAWVTCNYAANVATYTFSAGASAGISSGVKQAQFTATNIAGINTGTTLTSITLDNTAPTIGASTITSPISGTFGGTGITISWTAGNITDNIGISYVKLEYFDGAGWNLISTGANAGTSAWNISTLPSGASYKLRISVFDGVGQSASQEGGVFAIDKVAPTVPVTAVTYPNNAGVKIKGGSNVNITWNAGSITDNIALATNPITLSYSTDGGTNYTQIATSLANNGTYAWAVPSGLNNSTMKIRLEATDNVGNKSSDASDNNFEVDSTAPVINITYAGNGGSTPQTNAHINSSGFDVSAGISDSNLSGGNISYSLYNQTAGTYFNGTDYTGGVEIWNTLAASTGSSYNLSSTITSSIIDGNYYKLKLRADDSVGNSFSTAQVTFIGDTVPPALAVATASGTYFSGSVSIAGTSSDTGSAVSSVNLEIQKWAQWWDGSAWVGTQQLLVATTADSYANWSYNFNPATDGDGQAYTVTVTSHDHAYKTNNSSSSTITLVKDTSGPAIAAGVFTQVISGIQKDGNIINITWNTGAITSTGAGVNPNSIVLKFNNGAGIATITGAIANDGIYSYTLPTGDTQNAFFVMEASDTLGNLSNTVASSGFALDSTPPTIGTIETIEDTLGQINGVNIFFSEPVIHSSIRLSDFGIAGVAGMQTGTISDVGTGTVFAINFTATGTTATTPSVTYTAGTLTDLAGKPLANVTKVSVDKATPRFTSAKISDNNGNGRVDRIVVQASESLGVNTDTSSWTLNSPLPGVSITSASVAGSTAVLTLSEPTTANTSTGGMTVSFANTGSWKDSANNLAPSAPNLPLADMAIPTVTQVQTVDNSGSYAVDVTFSESITGTPSGFTLSGSSTFTGTILSPSANTLRLVTADSTATDTAKVYELSYNGSGTALKDSSNNYVANFSNTSVTDAIAPKILTRTTIDSNGNGKIDGIRLGFSEPLAGTSSGVTVSVAGYVVTGYSIIGTGITANLTEGVNPDTSATPLVQLQNTTLADAAGNVVPSEGGTTAATDAVGPVVTNVRFDGVNTLYATFSESVSGSITPASFVLSGATATISSVSIISGNSTGTITLNNSGITPGSSELSFSGNSVGDALGNQQSMKSFAKISASVIINEVMFSSTLANQYIELRNLGSTSVSLSGWTLQNAGVTLPAGAIIAANGFYLIANTGSANSILTGTITPDFITASLSLSPTTQSDLVLKDTQSIVFDSAKASPWAAGSGAINVAMERKSSVWDGLQTSSWYAAQTSLGFDTIAPLGTPGTANVFDAAPPAITSFTPANDTLYPIGNITLVYNYSDSGGMAVTPSHTFLLEKNNGAGWYADVTTASLSSSGINASTAHFTTNTLAYGQYRATFTVVDAAGNNAQQVSSFYVDAPSMTVSTGSYSIGALSTSSTVIGAGQMTITVQTIGAGFQLSLGGSGTLDAGISQIGAWNGTTGYGVDYAATGSGTSKSYSGTLTGVSGATLENFATGSYIGGNGNLHTFTYTVKYGGKIDTLQAAGVYNSHTPVHISLQY